MTNLINKLTKLAMIPILAGSLNGCADHKEYHFDGNIGNENVLFYEDFNKNILKIGKPRGEEIAYVDDYNGNLKIDYVVIWKNKEVVEYENKNLDESRQKEFDSYLLKIKETKK